MYRDGEADIPKADTVVGAIVDKITDRPIMVGFPHSIDQTPSQGFTAMK